MSEEEERAVGIAQYVGMGLFITLTAVIALILATPFEASDIKAFQNPASIWNPIYFFILIIGFTALILIVLRFGAKRLIYLFMLAAVAVTLYYVMDGLLLYLHASISIPLFGSGLNVGALIITLILSLLLYKYPEWYVINATGLIIAGGAAAIFGISLIPELVVLLMIILAVYDAMSVYKTKHMVSLAESVIDLRIPILFVMPRKRNFSTLNRQGLELGGGDAFFMGLGDAIIPSMLVVSAYVSYPSVVPALGALAGTLVGYSVLTRFSGKGNPHAGLPFLNTGSIIGFLIGLLLMNI
ncbi:MAG: hypothetical protein J7I99_01835 [Methanophagales archaeon]|nr:hypothetical protein [Methanophagales archaeon]